MTGPDSPVTVVVRGFGYDIRHVVTVPESAVLGMHWITEFHGIATPLVARCGRQIRSVQPCVVVMKPYPPTCPTCLYATRGEAFDNERLCGEVPAS